ncbi:hypothetical protein EEA47_18065 [Vibrio alginolyticus]|uniref:Uncharacterized protein n=1 Tax=Vibrio alginolyticus TaxID=663 RepID=A0AA36XQJ0_VIBAL|nr:hypothetical protein AL545_05210 [Vibrio alginolyticus]EGQ9097401.1 hypothetical protein [Vibrio alginolyticus]EGQ9135223.1 hypothetical protein [Vibrio alginolyticus]EGQ9762190.1 hypothetical protein [Vibrio alginolyticus]EGR0026546.1 hypothetical protein [Vibrio alginolyticus]
MAKALISCSIKIRHWWQLYCLSVLVTKALCVNIRIVCLKPLQGVTCFLEKSQNSVQLAF